MVSGVICKHFSSNFISAKITSNILGKQINNNLMTLIFETLPLCTGTFVKTVENLQTNRKVSQMFVSQSALKFNIFWLGLLLTEEYTDCYIFSVYKIRQPERMFPSQLEAKGFCYKHEHCGEGSSTNFTLRHKKHFEPGIWRCDLETLTVYGLGGNPFFCITTYRY